MADTSERRTPSQWGEGAALEDEILAAAARLLTEAGREERLSLRAVARDAGISAPSIYLHYENRSSLVAAVTRRAYEELVGELDRARAEAAGEGPRGALRAMARRHCSFAWENARRYRLMSAVERTSAPREESPRHPVPLVLRTWRDALTACREAGYAQVDEEQDAMPLWSPLHGMATLTMSLPFEVEADGPTGRPSSRLPGTHPGRHPPVADHPARPCADPARRPARQRRPHDAGWCRRGGVRGRQLPLGLPAKAPRPWRAGVAARTGRDAEVTRAVPT